MLLGWLNFVFEVAQPVWEFLITRFHGSESFVRWVFYCSPIQVHVNISIVEG